MKLIQYQKGVTLFIALVFLLIMTLFAVSSIRMSTVNMKIVGNMQSLKQMEYAAQDAIEQMLSDSDRFGIAPDESDFTLTFLTTAGTISETLTYSDSATDLANCKTSEASFSWGNADASYLICALCIDYTTASGYSAVQEAIIPEDVTWEIFTHVQDSLTGANIDLHQGFEMRMLANNCPTPI